MDSHKGFNAFAFGLFSVTLALIIFISIKNPSFLKHPNVGGEVIPLLMLSGVGLLFAGGIFYNGNWIQGTQLIIICMLTVFLSSITNVLIGLAVGAVSFGILTFGYNFSLNGIPDNTGSFIWIAFKWLAVSVAGTIVSMVAEKIIGSL